MTTSELTRRQLASIDEVLGIAARLGVDVWLRGGWAVDFYLGRVTRPHADVDWFVWSGHAAAVTAELLARGWVDRAEHPADQQIDLSRDGVAMRIAPMAPGESCTALVNGGPSAGSPWPAGMIADSLVGQIDGRRCLVISPEAQLAIKRRWDGPDGREDGADVEALQAAMADRAGRFGVPVRA